MAFRLRADDGPTLNAGLVALLFFQGIWTSIAKKPYIFVIFQRGGCPDPMSPLLICPCTKLRVGAKYGYLTFSASLKKILKT